MNKRLLCIALVVILLFSAASCKRNDNERVYCDIAITLPEEYEDYETTSTFDIAFKSGKKVVGITRISFDAGINSGIAPTHTADRFAEEYKDASGYSELEINKHGDVPYFTYTLENVLGNEYTYMPTFYRTHYAYFVIMFLCPSESFGEEKAAFLSYTESVRIVD